MKMKAGDKVKANTPYFVKAKNTSNDPQVITVTDATLKAAEEKGFDMYSAEKKISIMGIYSTKTATEEDHDWYAYGGGLYIHAVVGQQLSPFRFFLTITNREDNLYASSPNPNNVKLKVLDDEEETGLDQPTPSPSLMRGDIYDLSGRRILNDNLETGIYIINGKKVFVR